MKRKPPGFPWPQLKGWKQYYHWGGQSWWLMPTTEPVLRWAILRFRRRLHIVSNSVVIFNFNQNQANTLSLSEWVSSHDPQGDRVRKNVFVSRQIKEIRGAYECSCWPKAWSMKQNFHGAAPRPSSVLVALSCSVRTGCMKRWTLSKLLEAISWSPTIISFLPLSVDTASKNIW